MSYKNHIKPIVLALSIVIGVLLCTFTTVIADEHAETTEEAETTRAKQKQLKKHRKGMRLSSLKVLLLWGHAQDRVLS